MDAVKSRTLPLSGRGFNFETIMWFFTRLSALAMYLFIITGFVGALILSAQTRANFSDILRWAFFPSMNANPLSGMTWIAPLVRLMVIAFLLIVSAHGVHGVLAILDDYFTSHFWRRTFRNVIMAFFVVANAIAIYILWTS